MEVDLTTVMELMVFTVSAVKVLRSLEPWLTVNPLLVLVVTVTVPA